MALRLSEELTRGKCGRVSFMPLNRLRPPDVKYPEQVGGAQLRCACCAVHAAVCMCYACTERIPVHGLSC